MQHVLKRYSVVDTTKYERKFHSFNVENKQKLLHKFSEVPGNSYSEFIQEHDLVKRFLNYFEHAIKFMFFILNLLNVSVY